MSSQEVQVCILPLCQGILAYPFSDDSRLSPLLDIAIIPILLFLLLDPYQIGHGANGLLRLAYGWVELLMIFSIIATLRSWACSALYQTKDLAREKDRLI